MASTAQEAADEIAGRICGCFGSVDLLFAVHGPDMETAKALKKIARNWNLDGKTIEAVIEPRIRTWLEAGYWKHGGIGPEPYGDTDLARSLKIVEMVHQAVLYLAPIKF